MMAEHAEERDGASLCALPEHRAKRFRHEQLDLLRLHNLGLWTILKHVANSPIIVSKRMADGERSVRASLAFVSLSDPTRDSRRVFRSPL
jgi:hypothetical protein